MTRQILAFFASSFLTVAMTIPAMAEETDGTIESIDEDLELLTLEDGSRYVLPGDFDYKVVKPGMRVVLIYDQQPPLQLVGELQAKG